MATMIGREAACSFRLPLLSQLWTALWSKFVHSRSADRTNLLFAYWHCHCDCLVALYCLVCYLVPANYETLMLFMLHSKQRDPHWQHYCNSWDAMTPFCEGELTQEHLLASYKFPNPVFLKLLHNIWPGAVVAPVSLRWFYQRWWWLSPYISFVHAPLTEGCIMLLLMAIIAAPSMAPEWWAIGGRTLAMAGIRFWSLIMLTRKSGTLYLICRHPFLLGLEHVLTRSILFSVPSCHANIITAVEAPLLLILSCNIPCHQHCVDFSWTMQAALGMLLGGIVATHFNTVKVKVLIKKLRHDDDVTNGKLKYDLHLALKQLRQCMLRMLRIAGKYLWTVNGFQSMAMFVAYLILTSRYSSVAEMPAWLQILTV